MVYTPPGHAHLPNVTWTASAQDQSSTGPATRSDLNAVASSPGDTQAQVSAENAPLRIVYGRARLGAQIADVLTYQGRLVLLAVWGEGPIEAIESWTLNDETPAPGVQATHYTGQVGQGIDPTLAAAYMALGHSYMDTLPGIAYSVIQVPPTDSAGVPTVQAIIKGRLLYDPRTDTTGWSDNPALALADFLGAPGYGWGRAVDWPSVSQAADACDELVDGEKRRTIGLVLDQVSECRQWAEALRTYAGCWIAQGDSGLRLIPDVRM